MTSTPVPQQPQDGSEPLLSVSLPASGTEFYDTIMQELEPDLMTTTIDHVQEIHSGESLEEALARGKRYLGAFRRFDERLDEVKQAKEHEISKAANTLRGEAEKLYRLCDAIAAEQLAFGSVPPQT